jgi:drug/metabolite transporter (DMT)-like permease
MNTMKIKDVGMLITLAAFWGASFLFIRVAAPVLGPFVTVQLRVSIAALALMGYAWATRRPLHLRGYWKPFLIMGLLNGAIPFSLFAVALIHLNASFESILNATAAFFTALVAAVWLKERFTLRKAVGIGLGILGVAVLVGWNPVPFNLTTALAVLATLGATLSYGLAAVYAKTHAFGISSFDWAVGQQLGASIWLLPFSLFTLPAAKAPSLGVIGAVLGVALMCTAAAYLLYFALIQNIGPTRALSVTLLIPAFGIAWGALFLGEPISLNMLVGLVIILMGMVLVLQLPLPRWLSLAPR